MIFQAIIKACYETILNIDEKKNVLLKFIEKFNNFINFYDNTGYFEFEMIEVDLFSNNIKYKALSDGEKSIYSKIVELKYELMNKEENNIFLLDEPDNFLHPNWSKEFIKILLDNIDNEKVQLILTSHSPFILSDLPKQNVIFLEKDENGNCKNATNEIIIETFGANIHTLLSHGFFMKDGLMGEFAKDKISQILFLLSGKIGPINIPYKNIKPIIQIIGEDFLREKLLKMYDEKFPISKEEKIEQLEEEIERLKK